MSVSLFEQEKRRKGREERREQERLQLACRESFTYIQKFIGGIEVLCPA
jgi:hypothetical protein